MSQLANILHITYDMRIGGTEQVIKNLVESSDQMLFSMSVLCIESPLGPFGQLLKEQGYPVFCLGRKPGFDHQLIKKIRQHIKENNIDIVHCHQYTPWVYGCLAALCTSVKVIFTEHGRFYPDRTSWKRRIINPLLMLATSRVTSISKATKQALIQYEYIPDGQIEVIYNGIKSLDPNMAPESRAGKENIILGTVARLDPIKNHLMMLEAFKKALLHGVNAHLIIVGDGEERTKIEANIEELSLENKVTLTGYITAPQAYIGSMDIFLLSSLSEGTSMTLLEAMSLAKPCVVTDAGGNPEIIAHNNNGIVVENDNSDAFAEGIIRLCENPKLRLTMGEKGRERFTKLFSTDSMSKNFEKLYIEISS